MQGSKNQACRPHRGRGSVVDSDFHGSKWTLFGPEERLLMLKARLGYTPLVEVNQAINAWSFLTTDDTVCWAPSPPVQIVHFSQA